MSILMLEVAGHFYLNGEQVGEKTTVIRLSNGKQIKIEQDVLFKGVVWPWKLTISILAVKDSPVPIFVSWFGKK